MFVYNPCLLYSYWLFVAVKCENSRGQRPFPPRRRFDGRSKLRMKPPKKVLDVYNKGSQTIKISLRGVLTFPLEGFWVVGSRIRHTGGGRLLQRLLLMEMKKEITGYSCLGNMSSRGVKLSRLSSAARPIVHWGVSVDNQNLYFLYFQIFVTFEVRSTFAVTEKTGEGNGLMFFITENENSSCMNLSFDHFRVSLDFFFFF